MRRLLGFASLFLALSFSISSWAGFKEAFEIRLRQRQNILAEKRENQNLRLRHANGLSPLAQPGGQSIDAKEFDQAINHDDPKDTRSFKQRYWTSSQFAENQKSPVLLFLCGEWTCGPFEFSSLAPNAKKLKAHMVTMEHRYYGKSQPFDSLTTENLKFLSTKAALQDFAVLQASLQKTLGWTGPWIVIGGSYSANLAAYYRAEYPQLVKGAWASSGPVKAKYNFEEFDHHVATVAGRDCAKAMRTVVNQIEGVLKSPEDLLITKKLFEAEVLEDNTDFLYLVADIGALAIQYGYRDAFCESMTTQSPLTAYSDFTKMIFKTWGMTALSGSAAGALSLNPEDYEDNAGRQWFYQSCMEYGYWQNAYHDAAVTVRSTLINSEYHSAICKRLFGFTGIDHTRDINDTFLANLLSAKTNNIIFTNGSRDPWSRLSIVKGGEDSKNPGFTLFTIDGAAHCDDLRAESSKDSESMKQARALISAKLAEWVQ